MAVWTKTYDKDTLLVNKLAREILESGITDIATEFQGLEDSHEASPTENLTVTLASEPSGADITTLDSTVSGHTVTPGPYDKIGAVACYVDSAAPTVDDDVDMGIPLGAAWLDTSTDPETLYECRDNASGAADWSVVVQGDDPRLHKATIAFAGATPVLSDLASLTVDGHWAFGAGTGDRVYLCAAVEADGVKKFAVEMTELT